MRELMSVDGSDGVAMYESSGAAATIEAWRAVGAEKSQSHALPLKYRPVEVPPEHKAYAARSFSGGARSSQSLSSQLASYPHVAIKGIAMSEALAYMPVLAGVLYARTKICDPLLASGMGDIILDKATLIITAVRAGMAAYCDIEAAPQAYDTTASACVEYFKEVDLSYRAFWVEAPAVQGMLLSMPRARKAGTTQYLETLASFAPVLASTVGDAPDANTVMAKTMRRHIVKAINQALAAKGLAVWKLSDTLTVDLLFAAATDGYPERVLKEYSRDPAAAEAAHRCLLSTEEEIAASRAEEAKIRQKMHETETAHVGASSRLTFSASAVAAKPRAPIKRLEPPAGKTEDTAKLGMAENPDPPAIMPTAPLAVNNMETGEVIWTSPAQGYAPTAVPEAVEEEGF